MRHYMLVILCSASLWCSICNAKAQVTFLDDTFDPANWSLTVITQGNGGSVTASQISTGGNPGAYRTITDTVNQPGATSAAVNGFHLSSQMIYTPQLGGISSIDYSHDFRVRGSEVGVGLALQQGNVLYFGGYSIVNNSAWSPRTILSLHASDFSSFTPNAPGVDFSGNAAPIKLGFIAANSEPPPYPAYMTTLNVDNFRIQINTVPPSTVPEPGIFAMLTGTAFFGVNLLLRRRQKVS